MPDLIDLTGIVSGNYTVLRRDWLRTRPTFWVCRCVCGSVHSRSSQHLRTRSSIHCKNCRGTSLSHADLYAVLEANNYNIARTARELQVSDGVVRIKMKKYQIVNRIFTKPKVETKPKERFRVFTECSLRAALDANRFDVKSVAYSAGVSLQTVYKYMKAFNISVLIPKKRARVRLHCIECGKSFEVIRSRGNTARFCSLFCSGNYTYRNTCMPNRHSGTNKENANHATL